jgi:nicotinate-nucleotide pyrophosphorylase (carboxylating)
MQLFDIAITDLEELIRRAFAEDFAHDDITSLSCIPESTTATAKIVLKQIGCIAGLKFIPTIFQLFDPSLHVKIFIEEGEMCDAGAILAEITGPARSILSAERVALNFLQHLSGVASLTSRCVARARGTSCQILDTRKTILGLRSLQKYAVRIGGGTNHRLHLADRILIKNNHLALASAHAPAPLFFCIRSARFRHPKSWIEVEIDSPDQFTDAIHAGADAVLLDNMTPREVEVCAKLNQMQEGKKAYLEASGGITLDNLAHYAAWVDGISIGALTHSAPALDISLRVSPT